LVTLSTCGSDFDTVLEVYGGTCEALTTVAGACNDSDGPACPIANSASVQFSGIGGLSYWILAGGAYGARGKLSIVAQPMAPVNEQCDGAIALQPNVTLRMDTYFAAEAGDPVPRCRTNFGGGVWFTLTPASNGLVTVSTCGSDFDTVLQVFSGTCNALMPVSGGCNDDSGPACTGRAASVQFSGAGGVAYWILAGGYRGARGMLNIVADYPPPPSPRLRITLEPGPAVLLQISGAPRYAYSLDVCTNLGSWLHLTNLTVGADGRFNFTDTGASTEWTWFYRLTSPQF
jgi:hypothetical protein